MQDRMRERESLLHALALACFFKVLWKLSHVFNIPSMIFLVVLHIATKLNGEGEREEKGLRENEYESS